MIKTTTLPIYPQQTKRFGRMVAFRQGRNNGYDVFCAECEGVDNFYALVRAGKHSRHVRKWADAIVLMQEHEATH